MFHLDHHIAAWRRRFEHDRAFTADDIRELERHVRDGVASLQAEGLNEEEAFYTVVRQMGDLEEVRAAYRNVLWGKLRRKGHRIQHLGAEAAMMKQYGRAFLRQVRRYPVYTTINSTGLAVALACCLLMLLYVRHELSFDGFHPAADRLYRVRLDLELNGVTYKEASIQFPAAEALRREYPGVEETVRLYREGTPLLRYGEHRYTEEYFLFADRSFFRVFGFKLKRGDPAHVLDDPNSIVLTERAARKYFGTEDPVGKWIQYNTTHTLRVAGIAEDPPANSHLRFDMVAPLDFQLGVWKRFSGTEGRENKWFWTGAWTYVLLRDPAAAAPIEKQLDGFVEKYFPDRYRSGAVLSLQPIRSIHLHSHLDNELGPNGNVLYVRVLAVVALLVLLVACVNSGNLLALMAIGRMRETAVRKTLGAHRWQLALQLAGEAVVSSALAVVLAVGLAYLFLPTFNRLAGAALSVNSLWDGPVLAVLILLPLVIGCLAGGYPALAVSRVETLPVLRGEVNTPRRGGITRPVLLTMQFTAAIGLLIALGGVYQQVQFLKHRSLGFDRESVAVVKMQPAVADRFETFRQELMKHPAVVSVAGTSDIPGEGANGYRFVPEGGSPDEPVMLPLSLVDYDYLDVLNVRMVEGRTMSRAYPSDAGEAFIVNRLAAVALGLGEHPVGATLQLLAPGTTDIDRTGRVVGLVEDFHTESLHNPLKPLVLAYSSWPFYALVRMEPGRTKEAVAHLEQAWNRMSPDWPLEHVFLSEKLDRHYAGEQQLISVIGYLTGLAVLIACLGLVALSAFSAARRQKEVCIRKVHGATLAQVSMLLCSGYIRTALVSFAIAAPATYLAVQRWLDTFAYHTDTKPEVFVISGLAAAVLTLLSVGYQAVRVARSNPAEVLRHA